MEIFVKIESRFGAPSEIMDKFGSKFDLLQK